MRDLYESICRNIKELRVQNNRTQKEIAQAIDLDPIQYSRYENGNRRIPLDILAQLAAFYDVSLDELCGLSDY